MPDETTSTPAENPAIKTAQSIGGLIATAIGVAFPEERVLLIALQAIIRTAPELYLDAVALFSKKDPTPEEKAAFTADLIKYANPEVFYDEARARAAVAA